MIDVTHLGRGGPGLTDRQLSRLQALERSTHLDGFQAGEARFLATAGDAEQRDRALKIAERAVK